MKKWIYLIFPGSLLGLFLVFYFAHEKQAVIREKARAEKVAAKLAQDKAQKDEAEKRAKEQAMQTQKTREEEDRKKEEDRRAKQAKADKDLRDETNGFLAEADRAQKEAMALEIELDRLHKEKDRLSREAFDLAKAVELAKVARRNAEMEGQRLIEMISRRAADSSMTRMPPPPPVPAK